MYFFRKKPVVYLTMTLMPDGILYSTVSLLRTSAFLEAHDGIPDQRPQLVSRTAQSRPTPIEPFCRRRTLGQMCPMVIRSIQSSWTRPQQEQLDDKPACGLLLMFQPVYSRCGKSSMTAMQMSLWASLNHPSPVPPRFTSTAISWIIPTSGILRCWLCRRSTPRLTQMLDGSSL